MSSLTLPCLPSRIEVRSRKLRDVDYIRVRVPFVIYVHENFPENYLKLFNGADLTSTILIFRYL